MMKTKLYISIIISLMYFNVKAQFFGGYTIKTLDSISQTFKANKVLSKNNIRYLISEKKIYKYDTTTKKLTNISLDIYSNSSCIDTAGNLYVKDYSNLYIYSGNFWQKTSLLYASTLYNEMIADADGGVYFYTQKNYLLRYNGSWKTLIRDFQSANEKFNGFCYGAQKQVYIISATPTAQRIYELKSQSLKLKTSIPAYASHVQYDSLSNLYYTNNGTLIKKNSNDSIYAFTKLNSPMNNNVYNNFKIGPDGTIHFLKHDSLFFYDSKSWNFITNNADFNTIISSDLNDHVYIQNMLNQSSSQLYKTTVYSKTFFVDKIICGTYINASNANSIGISPNANTTTIVTNKEIICSNYYEINIWDAQASNILTNKINGVKYFSDNSGVAYRFALATNNGFYIADNKYYSDSLITKLHFSKLNSILTTDSILAIYKPKNIYGNYNKSWLNLKNNGCAIFENDTIKSLLNTSNSKLPSNRINRICFKDENQNQVAICTDKGVLLIDNNVTSIIDTSNSKLPSNKITHFNYLEFINSKFKWLITTADKGLALVDYANNWYIVNTTNSNLKNDSIEFVIADNWHFNHGANVISNKKGLFNFNFVNDSIQFTNAIDTSDVFYDYDEIYLWCEGGGYKFSALSKSKIVSLELCYGSIMGTEKPVNKKAWFVNQTLNIELNNGGDYSLELYDILGNKVWYNSKAQLLQKSQFQVPNLTNGIYILTLKSNTETFSQKLIYNTNN